MLLERTALIYKSARTLEIVNVRRQEATTVRTGLGRWPMGQDYFLPAFFAAQ